MASYIVDCLLYTSDAADDMQCVDLGGRRIIKKRDRRYGRVPTARARPRAAAYTACFFKQKTAYEM